MASVSVASAHSTPATSAATFSRKRKLASGLSGLDPTLQTDSSGQPSKKARTSLASSTKALKPEHSEPHERYQLHSSPNFSGQSHGGPLSQYPPFEQSNASAYGNPTTGGVQGAPYFPQRANVRRRPGEAYPEIEGYHTPSIGFGLPSAYDEGRSFGHGTVHTQQFIPHHNTATTNPAVSSGIGSAPTYTTSNSYRASHESSRGQRKRQAETEDEGSDLDSWQAKKKRRRNA